MTFGKKLKLLRIEHNLEQSNMALKLHLSQPVYSRYERGEKSPSEELLTKVSETFDVSREWLLSESGTTINFENGSIATGANVNNIGNNENFYSLPKEYLDMFLAQQKSIESLLILIQKRFS